MVMKFCLPTNPTLMLCLCLSVAPSRGGLRTLANGLLYPSQLLCMTGSSIGNTLSY